MIRGIYTAAAGLNTVSKSLDVISNNMANARTAGYKSESLTSGTFDEQMALRLEGGSETMVLGTISLGKKADQVITSFDQGTFEPTGRSLDLAISGEGFLTVARPDGSRGLTRNGQLDLDGEGYLTVADGSRVLGKKGPIQVGGADFTVSDVGEVSRNGAAIDTLAIYTPLDKNTLQKYGEGMFTDGNPPALKANPFQGKIIQGSVETSNVDIAQEMAKMMSASRSYQSCSQVIKILDQIEQKAVSEIGRL